MTVHVTHLLVKLSLEVSRLHCVTVLHVLSSTQLVTTENVVRSEVCPDVRLAGGKLVSARRGSLRPHVSLHPPTTGLGVKWRRPQTLREPRIMVR